MPFLRNARPHLAIIKRRQEATSMPEKSDLRNAHRPRRSMFTRQDATSMPEKSVECLNDSDRTCSMSLDEEQDILCDCSLDESSRIIDLQRQTELINSLCERIEEEIRALRVADLNMTRARALKPADLNKTRARALKMAELNKTASSRR